MWQVRIVILSWGQKTLRLTLSWMDQLLLVQTSLIQAPSALFSLHYVSDYGLGFLGGGEILLGLYQFYTSYKTNITCTSVCITSGLAVCASGIALATRTASGTSRSLDLGYVYPIGDMSVGGGIALPVLGCSGKLAIEWTTFGNALSGRTAKGLGTTEKLSPEGKAFSSFLPQFWLLN